MIYMLKFSHKMHYVVIHDSLIYMYNNAVEFFVNLMFQIQYNVQG